MTEMKKFFLLFTLLIFFVGLIVFLRKDSFCLYGKSNQIAQYVIFFNEYKSNGKERLDWIYYFDKEGSLICRNNFKAKNKVQNQIKIKDKVYSYGYGGIYETDLQTKKTIPLNTDVPVNIVKFDNHENIFFYQNGGFKNNNNGIYDSKILKNNELFLTIDYAIVDFCIYDNYLYVTTYNDISLKKGKILIYKNKELINSFDVNLENGEGNLAIYNDNIFFLASKSAFKISDFALEEIYYKNIDITLSKPIVINNIDFSKLYINSQEVILKDNCLFFIENILHNETNYDIYNDNSLDCSFNKEEQTLLLNSISKKINDNMMKSKFMFLSAFEI